MLQNGSKGPKEFSGPLRHRKGFVLDVKAIFPFVAHGGTVFLPWEWIKLAGGWDPADYTFVSASFDTQWIPEPSTLVLLGIGAAALLAYARRKRRRR